MTDGGLVGLRPRLRIKSYEIDDLPKNSARGELREERCENGGLDAFGGERRDTFITVPRARWVRPLNLT